MYRRVVSLILVPCLLLTQSAALGHCHREGTPTGHDYHPHFHTTSVSAPHDHGSGGHRHHDDELEPTPAVPPNPDPSPNHDDDAVYVTVVAVATGRVQAGDDDARVSFWHLSLPDALTGWLAGCRDHAVPHLRPPPGSSSPDCPLYVRHLALLI